MVLPPREGFSPDAVGAVGLLAHRLARAGQGRASVVIGAPTRAPAFADVRFLPAPSAAWPPWNRVARYAAGVARVLRRLRPALVEVHNRPDLALRLSRHWPVMLVLHNDPQGMRGARTPAARTELLRRLSRVVAVSGWVRDRLLDGAGAPARPPSVLPNCLDLARLPPPVPLGDRDRVILFAGRVVADKGADLFVCACAEALPDLPGWRAEMIGADRFAADAPDTPFLRQLRPEAAAAGVRMLGHQPHDAVLAAMARAAIVVVPSRWPEPFGLTALEAMAGGAALIASDRGGLPELVGDAALTIDPDAPGALAAAMHALARDEARRAALAEAGQRRARLFDAPAAAAALDALREEAMRA